MHSRAALQGLFTGDALSMPVHWYYRPGDILRAFPPHGIGRMEPAPEVHPGSIMVLHDTRKGGRRAAGAGSREIVGEVILKGRAHLWGTPGTHYHHGMPAGENTLNAWCARWLIEHLVEHGDYSAEAWLGTYIERMTSNPPSHPDTYAESYHRGFFANLAAGKPQLSAGAVTHDTPSMGALVTVAPLALALLPTRGVEDVQNLCRTHVGVTHPDALLLDVVSSYVRLLADLLELAGEGGAAVATARRDAIVRAAAVIPGTRLDRLLESGLSDPEVVGGRYSLACYITDSWPAVCWLAARYLDDPDLALLVNTNLGGENAHRGSVLGTLVGLASGRGGERAGSGTLFEQLHRRDELDALISAWLERFR